MRPAASRRHAALPQGSTTVMLLGTLIAGMGFGSG